MDQEELDDVEPDVDPRTHEVDDVEPADLEMKLLDKIDKHQVTVSITPRVTPTPTPTSTVKRGIPKSQPVSNAPRVQYVRRADGKGFMKKIISGPTVMRPKKKKKKPFRGANYRFDGSSIKKRNAAGAAGIKKNSNLVNDENNENEFLNYLGLRKDSTEEGGDRGQAAPEVVTSNKAKKSFQLGGDETAASAQKRRLSYSDVLSAQKKMRRDQMGQAVRSSFGGIIKPVSQGKPVIKAETEEEQEIRVSSARYQYSRLRLLWRPRLGLLSGGILCSLI